MSNNTQRYEVVAEYPLGTWGEGTILIPAEDGEMYSKEHGYSPSDRRLFLKDMDKYPHLFRPLKWWEHVPVDELPKYVKCKYKGWGGVYKVGEWVASVSHKGQYYTVLVDGNNGCQAWGHICVPATEQEYNDYLTKQNSK